MQLLAHCSRGYDSANGKQTASKNGYTQRHIPQLRCFYSACLDHGFEFLIKPMRHLRFGKLFPYPSPAVFAHLV